MSLNLDVEPKRDAVLYVRIKDENKQFVAKEAEKLGISESVLVDKILDQVFNASSKTKSRRSS